MTMIKRRDLRGLNYKWQTAYVEYILFDEHGLKGRKAGMPKSIYEICLYLLKIPYVWYYERDRNRIADALDMRSRFCEYSGIDPSFVEPEEEGFNIGSASVLEVLAALSIRITNEYINSDAACDFFITLLENLGYERLRDDDTCNYSLLNIANDYETATVLYLFDSKYVIEKWMKHKYDSDGVGSPFPVPELDTDVDQRTIEMWDQAQNYIGVYIDKNGVD